MSTECERLQRFADGELAPAEAAAFRGHLARCSACQAGLLEHLHLDTLCLEATLRPAAPGRRFRQPRWHRRWVPLAMVASVLVLLATGLWLRQKSPVPGEPPILLALSSGRSLEPRFTHPSARAWRPYTVGRAAEASDAEQVPVGILAELERRGDFHGLATAHLLSGEQARAERALKQAGDSADVDCDRAVLALERGDLSKALRLLDGVLAKVPAHPQALWNRALALQRLGLTLSAAESFSAVAALGEPGWAEEARQRAEELRRRAEAQRASWQELSQRGADMVKGGAPLPLELARRYPGLSRLFFYDAVRASSSRAQVEALRPLAAELDRSASAPVLERYVQRVASSDFGRRAGLAREYARLASGQLPLDEAGARALLDRLRSAGLEDLEQGAMLHTHQLGAQLERYQVLAARSADPWFELIAAHEQARALVQRGELLRAEGQLATALKRCQETRLEYRCVLLELELADLYTQLHRLEEARAHAWQGVRTAQAGNEWVLEGQSLMRLAEVARFEGAFPLTRAYLHEELLREPGDCRQHTYVRDTLTDMALLQLDGAGAAREYAQPQACELPPSLHKAAVLAELVRLNGGAQLEEELRGVLAALRASSATSPGERAMLDHLEARAVLERNREAGRALLHRSIEAAEHLPRWEVNARKARAHSDWLLAVDAARAGEADAALGAIADGLEVAVPSRCALGVAVDDERLVQVARDAQGRTVAVLGTRAAGEPQVDSLVPEPLRRHLAGCETVRVLATPPVQGKPRLLPADMAWSYQLPGGAAPRASGLPERRLVVSSVETPPSLGLPPLGGWRASGEPPQVELTGAAATPSRVLAELPEATVIELHVHGLENLENADASSLVLAQEPDGRFALEAQAVRQLHLRGAPLVILAACDAARTLPWMHQSWSLPAAFLEGGAAAVLASPEVVQDAEAPAFFHAVRERIRAGATPAVALREERVRWLARDGRSWVQDVMLFE